MPDLEDRQGARTRDLCHRLHLKRLVHTALQVSQHLMLCCNFCSLWPSTSSPCHHGVATTPAWWAQCEAAKCLLQAFRLQCTRSCVSRMPPGHTDAATATRTPLRHYCGPGGATCPVRRRVALPCRPGYMPGRHRFDVGVIEATWASLCGEPSCGSVGIDSGGRCERWLARVCIVHSRELAHRCGHGCGA